MPHVWVDPSELDPAEFSDDELKYELEDRGYKVLKEDEAAADIDLINELYKDYNAYGLSSEKFKNSLENFFEILKD